MMYTSLLLPLLPAMVAAVTMDCQKIVDDKVHWNLERLGGPRQVHHLERIQKDSDNYRNTTFTLDICAPLKKQPQGCGPGTRICSTTRAHTDPESDKLPPIEEAFPIAGDFTMSHGRKLDPKTSRLKNSDSNEDSKKEGLRMTLNGGRDPKLNGGMDQRAIIDFICDKDRTGLEGPKVKRRAARNAKDDDDEDDGDKKGDGDDDDGDDSDGLPPMDDPDKGASLTYNAYNITSKMGTLRLTWRTKHACEDAYDKPDDDDEKGGKGRSSSSGWGFFTWFIIILFLAIAAYLIFGSWLNYNRYGARGWDLLPHGDSIRDVPYLLKDWGRRVFGGASIGSSRDYGYIRV